MQYSQLNQQPTNTSLRLGYLVDDDNTFNHMLEYLPNSHLLLEWLYTPRFRIMDRPHYNSEGVFILIPPNPTYTITGWEVSRDNLMLHTFTPYAESTDEQLTHLHHQLQIVGEREALIYNNLDALYQRNIDERNESLSAILIKHVIDWINHLQTILMQMDLTQQQRESMMKDAKLREIQLIVKFKTLLLETLSQQVIQHLGWFDTQPQAYNWLAESNAKEFNQKLEAEHYKQRVTEVYARSQERRGIATPITPTNLDALWYGLRTVDTFYVTNHPRHKKEASWQKAFVIRTNLNKKQSIKLLNMATI